MLGFAVAKNSELRKMASERLFLVFVQLVLKASMFSQVICACNDPNPPENMVVDRLQLGQVGRQIVFRSANPLTSSARKGSWWKEYGGHWRKSAKGMTLGFGITCIEVSRNVAFLLESTSEVSNQSLTKGYFFIKSHWSTASWLHAFRARFVEC